jgi:uncharacterized membrane protein
MLPGEVPLLIPLAWFVLAVTPLVLLRNLPLHRDDGRLRPGRLLVKAAHCAVFLTACDLLLDPLATSVGAWTWAVDGGYFGTPHLNTLGWFVVGFATYLTYFGLSGATGSEDDASPLLFDLIWTLANTGLLTLACVAAHNRLGTPVPTLICLSLTVPYWVYWLATIARGLSQVQLATAAISTDSPADASAGPAATDTGHPS